MVRVQPVWGKKQQKEFKKQQENQIQTKEYFTSSSSVCYLFKGLPKLSSRSHAQLLRDVSRNFEQENLHQAGHQPVLTNRGEK